jgi:hypothetical protein
MKRTIAALGAKSSAASVAALALCLSLLAAPATAQRIQGATDWTDQSGRLSMQLADSGWRAYPPPEDEPDLIALLLPDRREGDTSPQEVCSLRNPPTPGFEDRQADQSVANEMLRITVQLDAAASGEITDTGEQDGVLSAYTAEVVTDRRDGRAAHRVRRDFFLTVAGRVKMYRFMCVSYRPPEDDAPARLRALMDRLRFGAE